MPNKMERFTQRARRVLALAQEEAERLQHSYIGTEHLLFGLLREEGGVAGKVLRDLGVEQRRMQELVERLTRATPSAEGRVPQLADDTKHVLELAVDEARRMGHHYIGTEHLLLGVVRQPESVAIDILKRLGIAAEEIRRETQRALHESPRQSIRPDQDVSNSGARTARATPVVHPIFGATVSGPAYEGDVYMLMPFTDELQPVYDEVVKPVVEAEELSLSRGDDFYSKHEVIREVWSCLTHAKFIIADCTGQNPDVFYELGIANTLDKPFILLTQKFEYIPRAIRGKRALVYENTPEGRKALAKQLKTAIKLLLSGI